jgi:putative ABC transport system ATP-binding protein
MKDNIIVTRDLSKTYVLGKITVPALKPTSLTIKRGDYIAIVGPSGSGKSTFMNLLGCLDPPTTGHLFLEG